MNKRATIVLIIVMFGFVTALSILLISISGSDYSSDFFIGEQQIELLKKANEAENVLLYHDLAAKLAYEESLQSISGADCGKFGRYPLWNNNTDDCFPDDVKSKIISAWKPIFKKYLENYPEKNIPEFEVAFADSDNKHYLVALTNEYLYVPLSKDTNISNYTGSDKSYSVNTEEGIIDGVYHMKPNVAVEVYDADSETKEIVAKAREIISKCSSGSSQCINQEAARNGLLLGCDVIPEDIYYDFSYQFGLVFEALENECIYKFQAHNYNIKDDDFEFRISGLKSQKKVKLKFDGKEELIDLNGNDLFMDPVFNFDFKYESGKSRKIILNDVNTGSFAILYKKDNTVKPITFEEYTRLRSKPECSVNRNKYMFCAIDSKGIEHKFALTMADVAPSKPTGFIVKSKSGTEDSVIIEFNKPSEKDIDKILLYEAQSGQDVSIINPIELSGLKESNGKYTYEISGLTKGKYTYYLGYEDKAGQKGELSSQVVNIEDDLGPAVLTGSAEVKDGIVYFSVKLPTINSDGSTIKENELFVHSYLTDSCDDIELSNYVAISKGSPGVELKFNLPDYPGKTYCLVVRDANLNPKHPKQFFLTI